jgi:hypothetical protein
LSTTRWPAEHRLAGAQLSTESCDLVVWVTEQLVDRLARTDPAIIVYDERSRWSSLGELRNQPWAFVYGTNLLEAIAMARSSITSTGRLLIVAHSRPSAHLTASDEAFFNLPPAPETMQATAAEIARCGDHGVQVDLLVVPPAPGVEVPAWATEIVSAVRLTGGHGGSDRGSAPTASER